MPISVRILSRVERRHLVRGRRLAAGDGRGAAALGLLPLAALEALARLTAADLGTLAEQLAPAEQEEHDDAQQQVDHERADEQQEGVLRQVVALHHAVDDRAEHADRREAAGRRAVDDHQAHQQRVDAVLQREPDPDRGDDGHGARDDRRMR